MVRPWCHELELPRSGRALRDECEAADVVSRFNEWGKWAPKGTFAYRQLERGEAYGSSFQEWHTVRAHEVLNAGSHIVAVLVGDPHKCNQLADVLLYERAQYALPINFPCMLRDTERFRITPSPLHNPSAGCRFVEHINRAWSGLKLPRAPDSALQSRSPFAAGTVGGTVAG